jgi:hypothetical protein
VGTSRRDIAHVDDLSRGVRHRATSTFGAVARLSAKRRGLDRPCLGWREWVALEEWGVPYVKAKIDTGARTSSLHAFDLESFESDGTEWVRFEIHPWQRSTNDPVVATAPVLAWRSIKSSSGRSDDRPVVLTTVSLAGIPVEAEVTLTRRDEMGFRMLIGREALRSRFVVDPGVSYRGGRPSREIRQRNRGLT